jgi:hypothetical protein
MTRTVAEKLGLKPGMATRVAGLPAGLAGLLAPAIAQQGEPPVWLIGFAPDSATLAAIAPGLIAAYRPGGHLWLCYPKIAAGLKTDITRDRGWQVLDGTDLLPVAQISVDATWSALRWRHRSEIANLTRRF